MAQWLKGMLHHVPKGFILLILYHYFNPTNISDTTF